MNRAPLNNFGLQIGFAGLRYAMMGWVYALSNLEVVGKINALLTFVTAMTFVAGLELHQVANRSLLLGKESKLRWGFDRLALAILVIGAMAWLTDWLLFDTSYGARFASAVFFVAMAEYFALESGRLLIAKGRYLVATVCGFIRSVAPFIVVVVTLPTLESILFSWLLGTSMVLAVQTVLLWRSDDFSVEWRWLDREDYRSAAPFFAAGVSMALMPTIERWLVGNFFSAKVLGQYALAMTLVSLCELVLQGGIWQPFISRILQRLAHPAQQRATATVLMAATALAYFGGAALALLLSSYLLSWINKAPLPMTILLGTFMLGFGKAL
ncbi:MAG: hypothetical protein EBZ75_14975, partial [Oxalobacteraceae bacterium]|nr:hypothetical protein [Oxalobacteraceae bacterium]